MEKAFDGIEGYVYGQIPVQGEGRVDEYPWYFRERDGFWDLEIVDDKSINPECLPLDFFGVSGWYVEGDCCNIPVGRWNDISHEDAWKLIEVSLSMFRQGALTYMASRPFPDRPD